MTIEVDALYENGMLKPERPLPLQEKEWVRVTVRRHPTLAEQTAGMLAWKGDAATLERLLAENEEEI